MAKVNFDRDHDHLVTPQYSDSKGPVLRGEYVEVAMLHEKAGDRSEAHSHPEEQVIYVLSGRLEFTAAGETYTVEAGEASYHPSNEVHSERALEDSVALSFKNLVDPVYEATGRLSDAPPE